MKSLSNTKHRDTVTREYSDKLEQEMGFAPHILEDEFGYQQNELADIPADAVASSFGCGNPLSFGDVSPGDTVVDLGSGAGMDVILAAKKVGSSGKVIGIDMTASMIEKARTNIEKAGVASIAEIREGLIESLPIESGSVDWVISNCVVSLSPEKDRVFSEVNRILKPGGKMLLTDLTVEPIPGWLKMLIALKSPASAKAQDFKTYFNTLESSGLVHSRLVSRLVYDAESIAAMTRGELNKQGSLISALLTLNKNQLIAHLLEPLVDPVARRFSGMVSSIKIYAEKPA